MLIIELQTQKSLRSGTCITRLNVRSSAEKRRAKTLFLIFIIRMIPLLLVEVVGKGTIGKAGGMDVAENKAEVLQLIPKVTVMVVAMVTAGDTTNKKMTNSIKICI